MSFPDRVYGFSTPAIGQTRSVSPIRPTARANTYGSAMKDSVKLRSRRGNRDALGRFIGPKNKGHGTRLLEVKKDQSLGYITNATFIPALRPTGKHVGTANNYKKYSRLEGYSGMPRGARASTLGHYKKGRDRAAGEFKGTRSVVTKLDPGDRRKASRERKTAGTVFGSAHGLVAGEGVKGKAKSTATHMGLGYVGAVPGAMLAGAAARRGSAGGTLAGLGAMMGGSAAGHYGATNISHNSKWLKSEKRKKVAKAEFGRVGKRLDDWVVR